MLVAVLGTLTPLAAQTTTGTIAGTVVDSSGGVVPRAKVTAVNEATGDARTTETGSTGDFSFPSLLPATYQIQVEITGFQTYRSTGNVLTPNGRLALGEIHLTVGATSETVEVSAEAAQVATQSSENSALLTRDQFSMIPAKGRDLTNMLRLLPGVQMQGDQEAFGGATGFGATIGAVQGTRSAQQNLTVDGIVGNDLGAPAGLSGQLNMDAVQEVKVLLSSYQAEYGRNPGANISMTTRSGTKEYHGSAYYYFRNEKLNANDFFRNRSTDPRLNSRPALYRFNTMGFTIGGPLPAIAKVNPDRNKLFFFYSFDNTINRVPDTGLTRYNQPTALERTGDFSLSAAKPRDPSTGQFFPGDRIPASRINPSLQTLMNLYPLPNVAQTSLGNYETLRVQKIPNMQHVFRIDDKIGPNDTLYVRGAIWRKDTNGAGGTVGYGTTPIWPYLESHYQYSDDSIAVNYTHIWSPRIISEFTAGARHSTEKDTKNDFAAVAQRGSRKGLGINLPYLFPGTNDNIYDLIPNITYSGVQAATTVGFGTRFGLSGYDTGFNLTHATTFMLSNHTVKVGVYWNRGLNMEARSGAVNGVFDFGLTGTTLNPLDSGNHFANQLLGNFRTYTEPTTRRPFILFRRIFDWYAQDTWKVTRKLTLDYGLRFTHSPWFYQKNLNSSVFDPNAYNPADAPRQYTPSIVNGTRVGFDPVTGQTVSASLIGAFVPGTGNTANGIVLQTNAPKGFIDPPSFFLTMPRFGFAYDPFGDGKTAIRGGGGIFYQTEDDGFFTGLAQTGNPPFIYTAQAFNSNVSQLAPGSGFIFPPNVSGYDRRTGRPVVYNYSFGIQRNIGAGTIADVKYVGSLGRHLGGRRDINTLPLGTRFQPQNIDPTTGAAYLDSLLRPYRGYGTITMLERNLSSNYNSMQATLNRRFSRGFQFGIAYTLSKSLDYGSDERALGTAATPNYLDIKRNYGKSTFDQTHIFVANWQYDLPSLKKGTFVGALTKGWQYSGVASFSSGTPVGLNPIVGAADLLGGGGGGDAQRVNLTCNPNLGHFDKTPARFFNTSCVSIAGRGDTGNAPKDAVRGPGRQNFDMTLFRNFTLGKENRLLTFRWELYNVFNHTQFSAIDTNAIVANGVNVSTTFGSTTAAFPARQMQLSLRITF